MGIKAGCWAKEWDRSKKAFEKNTKSKKPSETFMKISLKSGLAGKFKKMDDAFNAHTAGGMDKKDPLKKQLEAIAALNKALLDAKKSCASYIKVIAAAWKQELKTRGLKMKLDSLSVLEKDMEAIIVSCESQANFLRKTTGVAHKEMMAAVRSFGVLTKILDASLKNGALFVARNQRNSNLSVDEALKFFRDNINVTARDINQNVGNIGKLYPDGSPEARTATRFFQVMNAWAASGDGASDVKKMKTMDDMLKLNKEMKKRISDVAAWRKKLGPPPAQV